jgi:uncharacterized protein YndB with AHSA1/START domain
MNCTPEDVFAVLEDGWSYGMWVVGAARIRDVDATWPQKGSRIHHSVGAWPLLLSDNTEVEDVDAPHRLQLRVKAWPTGEGRVTISCTPTGEVGRETEVVIEEQAVSGPAKLVPDALQDMMLHHRNIEALRRLAYLAEHRARSHG